jgi:hypothetical protein
MEMSTSWEADSFAATQEIPDVSLDQKIQLVVKGIPIRAHKQTHWEKGELICLFSFFEPYLQYKSNIMTDERRGMPEVVVLTSYKACSISENVYQWTLRFVRSCPNIKVIKRGNPLNFMWMWRWTADHSDRAVRAWIVVAHSKADIMGSNPIRGINVCVCMFCVCVVMCVG